MSLPIKVRLTAWYIALLSVILAVFGTFLFLRLKTDLVDALDHSLESRAAQISLGYQAEDPTDFQDVSDASLRGLAPDGTAAQLLSPTGAVLDATGDPAVSETPMIDPRAIAAALQGRPSSASVTLGSSGEAFRVLMFRLQRPEGPSVLVVGSSIAPVDRSVRQLLLLFITGIPIALALAGVGGWLIARRALRPVAGMTAEAREIRADRLEDRIAMPTTVDELHRLAGTLNDMLERLQEGVESQRRFVADASHDLRTPLTVMRSEIDVGLDNPILGDKEARALLTSNREEVGRMARTVDNLLTLASIDDGRLELLRGPVDLQALAHDVVEQLRPVATRTGVEMEVIGNGAPVAVLGDPQRLTQVLSNLVENAVKYAGGGAQVRVSVWRRNGEAGVSVSDTGPGIPVDAIPHVFDRFFRVDAARSSTQQGSGLGLAICRDIMDAHGGRLWVEDPESGGSSFSIALPTS